MHLHWCHLVRQDAKGCVVAIAILDVIQVVKVLHVHLICPVCVVHGGVRAGIQRGLQDMVCIRRVKGISKRVGGCVWSKSILS